MANDRINVGMLGYKFMGKAHSHAYREVSKFFDTGAEPTLKVIGGRTEEPLREAQERWGWEDYSTSWEELVERDDVDLVDIGTPNVSHHDIAVGAAENGKDVLCEKPLAMTVEEARNMLETAEEAGVTHMVSFNYRRLPALQLAKQIIDSGRLGDIHHFRAVYLQDWIVDPEFPRVWRLDAQQAGSGALGDLGAHIIDLARFLVGEIDEVVGDTHTFIEERPLPGSEGELRAEGSTRRGDVTVDDMCSFLARFENGARGTFEATRFAPGRRNGQRLEINGSNGSLVFNLEELNYLDVFYRDDPSDQQGFRRISVTEPEHPYIEAWWPPGHLIGYQHTFVHQAADLLNALSDGTSVRPDFEDGLRCQQVMAAVEESVDTGGWESPREQ